MVKFGSMGQAGAAKCPLVVMICLKAGFAILHGIGFQQDGDQERVIGDMDKKDKKKAKKQPKK